MAGVVTNLKKMFGKSLVSHPISAFRQFNLLNSFDPQSLTDLLQFSEQRFFVDLSPDLSDKKGLFFSLPTTRLLMERLLKKNPSHLMSYQLESFVESFSPLRQAHLISVSGGLKPLACRLQFFDFLLAPFVSLYKKDMATFMPQFASTLVNGGRAVFSFIHPALELFLYNQNPSSPVRSPNSLQNYFTSFKENNLYLEHLQEGIIDKEMKPFFHYHGGESFFEDYRGIPLVLFFRVVKYIK